ncbi:MAG: NAD-dependent deacetylase [Magnetococcales bacterium]|nr:NAD-dependent deacetylase [Magnetococcales bacterium]
MDESIRTAAAAIRKADALLITAGAGMGVDSGLPDFRGDAGFWKAYPLLAEQNISFERMANPAWFRRNPRLAWAFYGHRLALYRKTEPHAGFATLLEMVRRKPSGWFVLTSNVDGQFQRAGFPDQQIEECHGSIHSLQCTRPCDKAIWGADDIEIAVEESTFLAKEPLPTCPRCGAMARPNILMFNDSSWLAQRTNQQKERLWEWLNRLQREGRSLMVIEIGAGTAVATIRRRSEDYADRFHGDLVRINPRDFHAFQKRFISLPYGAADGISSIAALIGTS